MLTINLKNFKEFKLRVKSKWMRYARDLWWGDRLDSRFIALYYLTKLKNKRILDIGCNAGIVLSELEQSNFKCGVDNSLRAVCIAKELNNDTTLILKGDIFNLPVKSDTFDVIICLGMLELYTMTDKKRYLIEISRVLRKNGELIITTSNRCYLSPSDKRDWLDYDSLISFLKPEYEFEIYGFNPFPAFPYFLPNRILEKTPFIWSILFFMMKKRFMIKNCRSFFVIAKKKLR